MKGRKFKNLLNIAAPATEEKSFEVVIPGELVATKSGKTARELEAQDRIAKAFEERYGKIEPVRPVTVQIQTTFKVPGKSLGVQQRIIQNRQGIADIAGVDRLAATVIRGLAGVAYKTAEQVEMITVHKTYCTREAFTRIVVVAEVEVQEV